MGFPDATISFSHFTASSFSFIKSCQTTIELHWPAWFHDVNRGLLSSSAASPHLYKITWHCPWAMRKWLNSDSDWRGRSKPGCQIVGSHTWYWCWLTTEPTTSPLPSLSVGGVSAQRGWWDQGRSDWGYIGIFTPQNQPKWTFYGVKMMSEWLFNSFIPPTPKKIELLYPPKQISGYAPDRKTTHLLLDLLVIMTIYG